MRLDAQMIEFHKSENFEFYPNPEDVKKQLSEGKRKHHFKTTKHLQRLRRLRKLKNKLKAL